MNPTRGAAALLIVAMAVALCAGCAEDTGPAPAPPAPSLALDVVGDPATGEGCLVAEVAVGGGPRVRVLVDTGGSGLMLDPESLGPAARPTGTRVVSGFVGVRFPMDVVSATVAVAAPGGPPVATTPAPVAVGSVPAPYSQVVRFSRCGPVHGVLGVGVGGPDATVGPLASPLLQMARPLSDGFSLTVTGSTGLLRLGAPAVTPASAVLPLTRAAGTYPDGRPAYQRQVTLCWIVGPDRGCGPTNVDSGASALVRPDLLPGAQLPTGKRATTPLPAGLAVAVATPDGAVLDRFTTGARSLAVADLAGTTRGNTGLGFFTGNDVGFDATAGRAVITPRS